MRPCTSTSACHTAAHAIRAFRAYDEFAAYAARLTRVAGVPDYTFHWWRLRPHPKLGTVEIRGLDVQSSPERAAALIALVRRLAIDAAEGEPRPPMPPELLEEASHQAALHGVYAELPDHTGSLGLRDRVDQGDSPLDPPQS